MGRSTQFRRGLYTYPIIRITFFFVGFPIFFRGWMTEPAAKKSGFRRFLAWGLGVHGPSPPGYIMGFLAHPMAVDNPGEWWKVDHDMCCLHTSMGLLFLTYSEVSFRFLSYAYIFIQIYIHSNSTYLWILRHPTCKWQVAMCVGMWFLGSKHLLTRYLKDFRRLGLLNMQI